MYIIYEHTSGILQIGVLTPHNILLARGIFTHTIEKKHFQNNKLFFTSFSKLESSAWQEGDIFTDFRAIISNKFLKNIIYFIFKTYFLAIKCMFFISRFHAITPHLDRGNQLLLSSLFICFLSITSFFYFITGGFHSFKEQTPSSSSQKQKNSEDINSFKNFFKETKIAAKIAENNYFYLTAEIPKIKGISAFQALPLTHQNETKLNQNSEYSASIAVPFKKIIKITEDNNIVQVEPFLICDQNKDEKFYLFRLKTKDEVLIFKTNDLTGKIDYPHFVFFKSKEKYQACPSIL